MIVDWAHGGPSFAAAFLASLVEGVEALTVVLAVGGTRGWRGALAGTAAALVLLIVLVAALGSALTRIPLDVIQLAVGFLVLLFGLRWLRKAILRTAGILPLHDEAAAFAAQRMRLGAAGGRGPGLDRVAVATAFNIVMLEGVEVVFIVVAVGAGGSGLLWPASLGALAALAMVAGLGLVLQKPLASVPENTIKFGVGVLLSGFGTFWVGEGIGVSWPGADAALPVLVVVYLVVALATVRLCATRAAAISMRGRHP